jgi:Fe-S-cluster containining protein
MEAQEGLVHPTNPMERLNVSIQTPAGPVTVPFDVSHGMVPVTAIVRPLRRVGEEAQALEVRRLRAGGSDVSCRKGCAACCRMLVPVSAPEAFALAESVQSWSDARRQAAFARIGEAHERLDKAGLLSRLRELAEAPHQLDDEQFEPVNRTYFALKLPCPFLIDESCSIYEDRPAACRELQVTSPPDLCEDPEHQPVRPVPIPLRIGTTLAQLWAEVSGGPVRFIPLPLALEWAERHAPEHRSAWPGRDLLDRALDTIWRYLNLELAGRRSSPAASQKGAGTPP